MKWMILLVLWVTDIRLVKAVDTIHSWVSTVFMNVPDSYFLVLGNTSISINTSAPAIIMKINQIQERQHGQPVYIVYGDDAGVGQKYFDSFVRDNILKFIKQPDRVFYSIHDSMYYAVGASPNPTLKYVNNKRMELSIDAKYGILPDYLPCDVFVLKELENLVYVNKDSLPVNLLSYYYRLDNERFIELSDFNNRMSIINANTGNFEFIFDNTSINGVDLFAKYIAADSTDKTLAYTFNQYLAGVNRLNLNFEHVSVDTDHKLLVSGSISVGIKAPKNLYYRDDYDGTREVIRKGEMVGMYFPFVLRVNADFTYNVDDIYLYDPLHDNPALERKHSFLPNFFTAPVDSNRILVYCEPKRPKKFNSTTTAFMYASLSEHRVVPGRWLQCEMPLEILKKDYYLELVRAFQTKSGRDMAIFQPDGRIFDLHADQVLATLFDCCPNRVESFPSYVYEETEADLRHYIFDANFMFENNYFAVVFQNFDHTYLQLFTPELQSVQIFELTDLPWNLHDPLMKSIILLENTIVCLMKEGDEIRIRQFQIVPKSGKA